MNCPHCGTVLPQGAQFCHVCNAPVVYTGYTMPQQGYMQSPMQSPMQAPVQGYPGYEQQPVNPQGYAGQQGMPQGYPGQPAPIQGYPTQPGAAQQIPGQPSPVQPSSYGQQGYTQYTQQAYPSSYSGYYAQPQPPKRDFSAAVSALTQIPRVFLDAFRDPATTLTGLMERRDIITGPVVVGVALLMTFLSSLVVCRGFVGMLFNMMGSSLSSDPAVLNQGISHIAGKIGPAVGGILTLCQLAAILIPLAVSLVYICGILKSRFSFELMCGLCAITTLPTLVGALAVMLSSLLSPLIGGILVAVSMGVSLSLLGSLLSRVSDKGAGPNVAAKTLCLSLCVLLVLAFVLLLGGMMLSGAVGSTINQLLGGSFL